MAGPAHRARVAIEEPEKRYVMATQTLEQPVSQVPTLPRRIVATGRQLPMIPLAVLSIFVLTAIFAPWLAPHSATDVDLANAYAPPSWQAGGSANYILGADGLGRDLLSRIILGARVSLLVIVVTIPVAGTIGVAFGVLGAYRGGWVETLILRLVDVKLSIPTILLALLFGVIWGPSLTNLLFLVILTLWAVYARTVHAETLSLKPREYVLAARAMGASDFRIIRLCILPGLMSSITIVATLQIATTVLMEAGLSFLGVGLPPPTPAWGLMIADGRPALSTAWWVSTMPGIAMSMVILAANLTGDWLRDYLDPSMRGRTG
jgi:peptide/nickel transport system permease protein